MNNSIKIGFIALIFTLVITVSDFAVYSIGATHPPPVKIEKTYKTEVHPVTVRTITRHQKTYVYITRTVYVTLPPVKRKKKR